MANSSDSSIIYMVESIIKDLSEPLTKIEQTNGWCEETRVRWLKNFEMIRECLKTNQATHDASIARSMDFDGICSGQLFEQAAVISCMLRERLASGNFDA